MNYAAPTIADIDATLRETETLCALLNGLVTSACNMLGMLGRREAALRDCRESLTAHNAELAEREQHDAAMPPKELVVPVPAERVLSFASIDGASSNQSPRQLPGERS